MNTPLTLEQAQEAIVKECDIVKEMLLEKNRKYGNSVFEPINIFSKSNWLDIINIRIDDKLKRIQNRQGDDYEDTEVDLIGYLILKRAGLRIKFVPTEKNNE